MLDMYTKQPLKVSTMAPEYPWLSVPADQLEDVKRVLDAHDLRYEVSPWHVSLDNQPFKVHFYFRKGTDAARVQQLLDSA